MWFVGAVIYQADIIILFLVLSAICDYMYKRAFILYRLTAGYTTV